MKFNIQCSSSQTKTQNTLLSYKNFHVGHIIPYHLKKKTIYCVVVQFLRNTALVAKKSVKILSYFLQAKATNFTLFKLSERMRKN